MTEPPSKPAPGKALDGKERKQQPPIQQKTKPVKTGGLFAAGPVAFDVVANEAIEQDHHTRLMSIVFSQAIAIAILAALLIFLAPFMQPIYHFYARDQQNNEMVLDPLLMPNMTNRAVLSWAVTSVTEIMTIGFGDLVPQLGIQKTRFTPSGWNSFVQAFRKQNISEVFKGQQLVLTTAPSDTAVILAQGKNPEDIYQWKVQVPVIMTYATNNNYTQAHRAIVTLTIVRVSPQQNPAGIAIKNLLVE